VTRFTAVSDLLDELAPSSASEEAAWDDVLARVELLAAASATNGRAPAFALVRPRRRLSKRRAVLIGGTVVLLIVLFATPAFGVQRLVLDLIGRTNVHFTSGKSAPLEVKRGFFDLSLEAPRGMAPQAIASQARRVAVFHAFGHPHVLYVAPTRGGGFCEEFTGSFGGCRASRVPPKHFAVAPGAVNPFLLDVAGQLSPIRMNPKTGKAVGSTGYTSLVGGSTFAVGAASIEVEYENHASTAIPFVFVSKPINAGFFLYQIPKEHERPGTRVIAVAVRDKHGRVLARQPLQYAPPQLPMRTVTSPPSTPHPAATPPTPTPPFQQGSADGATVVVGSNRVAKFDTSHISAALRPLIANASYGCFRFMQYHQDTPAEFGFAPRTIVAKTIQISGLPTPYDGCEIQGSYGHLWPDSNGSHSAVEIAFTARGRHFFADRAAARDLALFVRSRRMQQIRKEQGQQLLNDIHAIYGNALAHSRIHYTLTGNGITFTEASTTGKQFTVAISHDRIARQNLKPYAFVF
jgi:hypothetical protein